MDTTHGESTIQELRAEVVSLKEEMATPRAVQARPRNMLRTLRRVGWSGVVRPILIVGISLTLAGAVAYASIPGPGGVINGCIKNSDSTVRVIDSTQTCGSNETALNWNQTGPQGPTGPRGPQ